MIRKLFFFSMISVSAFAAPICPLPDQENVAYESVVELEVRAPDDVLAYGEDELQFGELWLPTLGSDLERSSPIVALIHGGCWLSAYDIKHTHALSAALADAGYVVWSLEYRRTGDIGGGWPGTYDDIVLGLNFITELDDKQIDTESIAVIGHSAGGHLALLANNDKRLEIEPKLVLGMAPITDIVAYAAGTNSCQSATASFMGGAPDEVPHEYRLANPMLSKPAPNTRSVHGDVDAIVPLEQSTQNLPTEVIKNAGHFDFLHPHTPAFRAVLRELGQAL